MNRKDIIEIVIKTLIYALTLIGAALGIYSLSSCAIKNKVEHRSY